MSATVKVASHETDAELYDALARVFGEHENDGVRWVVLTTKDETEVTFFARRGAEA